MNDTQTPLQRWSTMVDIVRNRPLSDEQQPPLERALVEIAAYAERLEAQLADLQRQYEAQGAAEPDGSRWPQGDEAAKQLAEAVGEPGWNDMLLDIHNAIVTMGTYAMPLESELIGLTTTQWDHERARRIAAAVLQRLAKGGSHADAD